MKPKHIFFAVFVFDMALIALNVPGIIQGNPFAIFAGIWCFCFGLLALWQAGMLRRPGDKPL